MSFRRYVVELVDTFLPALSTESPGRGSVVCVVYLYSSFSVEGKLRAAFPAHQRGLGRRCGCCKVMGESQPPSDRRMSATDRSGAGERNGESNMYMTWYCTYPPWKWWNGRLELVTELWVSMGSGGRKKRSSSTSGKSCNMTSDARRREREVREV